MTVHVWSLCTERERGATGRNTSLAGGTSIYMEYQTSISGMNMLVKREVLTAKYISEEHRCRLVGTDVLFTL
jgi:hypothetical protein